MNLGLLEILLVFVLPGKLLGNSVRQCPNSPCPQQVSTIFMDTMNFIVLDELSMYKACEQYKVFFL